MKKISSLFLSVLIVVFAMSSVNFSAVATENKDKSQAEPSVSAQAFILYCADNGQIIYSKNENDKMKPASTTKLMTTLLALEEADSSNKVVTFSKDMIAEGSSIYMKIGDKLTLKDLAAGMMMASGNDAANATAIAISGSKEKFANQMNDKAKQIGMKNTHFVTPSGLDDDNHYSTAYDLAVLMDYALENEEFAKLTGQKSAEIKFIEPAGKQNIYANHNRLLSMYEYCIGGKTGYTMSAGRCLVSAAKKDELTLICVTLNDRNDWEDHKNLYEYGFSQVMCHKTNDKDFVVDVPCVGGEDNNSDCITVAGEKDLSIILPVADKSKLKRKILLDNFLYAPIKENDIVGKIEYLIDDKIIDSVNILAVDTINVSKNKNLFNIIKDLFTYG